MRRISLLPDGSETFPQVGSNVNTTISAKGRFVAFNYYEPLLDGLTGGQIRIYLWDRGTKQLELITVNNAGEPATEGAAVTDIAPHGHFVVFAGNAGNLTPGPDDAPQTFLRVLPQH
jgi:hypothetical protein